MAFTGPIEDRIAIRELLESYADCVNQRDAEGWAALWAEDGRWLLPNLGDGYRLEGRATIGPAWVKMMEDYHGPAAAPWPIMFQLVPGTLSVAGDAGEGRCYSFESFDDGTGRTIHTKGVYDDRFVRQDGRWLFLERVWNLLALDDHQVLRASLDQPISAGSK